MAPLPSLCFQLVHILPYLDAGFPVPLPCARTLRMYEYLYANVGACPHPPLARRSSCQPHCTDPRHLRSRFSDDQVSPLSPLLL